MIIKKCKECGVELLKEKIWKRAIYCSQKCFGLSIRTKVLIKCPKCKKEFLVKPARVKRTIREIHCSWVCAWNNQTKKLCKICGKEILVYPCLIERKKFCSKECSYLGLPNYKGGSTKKLKALRATKEYKQLRAFALQRDSYTCVLCGAKEGLIMDHIKSFAEYPELRFDHKNVRIICKECNLETDTYKRLWVGNKQYER